MMTDNIQETNNIQDALDRMNKNIQKTLDGLKDLENEYVNIKKDVDDDLRKFDFEP